MINCGLFKYSVLAAVFLVFQNTAEAANVSNAELKKMEQKVLQESMEHKKLQAQATQISLELSTVTKEMVKTAKKLQNNEDNLSAMERQLNILKTSLAEAESGFSKQDEELIKTLAALQNLALRPTESLFVQPMGPVDIIRSAIILRETIPSLEESTNELKEKLQDISRKKQKIEKQIAEISAQKKVIQKEHQRIAKLIKYKKDLRKSIEKKSEKTKKNVDKLASQAKDIRELLSQLEKQRKQKKEQEEKRKKEELRRKQEEKQQHDLIKQESGYITKTASGFAKAKGTLPLPARGSIISHYGDRKNKGVSAKGITIATRPEAQVVSPFDGNVVFAGPFKGYGNMIIIDHGGDYLSLHAGMEILEVELGQMLLAGEPIGKTSNSESSELYVEIRKNNQPVNPEAWFKI